MPQYQYEVKSGPGDVQEGVMEAENQRAVVTRLRELGYFPLKVEEFKGEKRKVLRKVRARRIRLKDRNIFFRQLANLYDSGMPLTRALTTLEAQTANPSLAKVIAEIKDGIQKGSTFAEAMKKHDKIFPNLYVNLIRAGESGGMLDEVLWRVVSFGEQEEELRGKTFAAMVYPMFLMFMGSVAIFILMSFVFPKFALVFEDFGDKLPLPTRITLGACTFMGDFWWLVLILMGVFAFAIYSFWRTPGGRYQVDVGLLKMPLVGDVSQRYEMAKFSRTLGTLVDNGVPILTSLNITMETLSNSAIAQEIGKIHSRVSEGDGISESMNAAKYFPPLVVSMFAVGEESGRLGAVSKRIADAYDVEVDRAVKTMTSMLEPIMIVVMGVIVGFLVISMLLPILQMSSNIA
jgi:type II secretion system protein F